MSLQDYLSLQNQMEGSVQEQVPQLFDKLNDKKVYAKSILETGGNVLGVGALTTGIKKLKGSKNILDKLNLSPEELDAMSEDLKAGNYQEVLAKISKKAVNKASAKLQNAIQKARGLEPKDGNLSEDVVDSPSVPSMTSRFSTLNTEDNIVLARNVPQVSQQTTARFRVPKRKPQAEEAEESEELPEVFGIRPISTVKVLPTNPVSNQVPRAVQKIKQPPKQPSPADEPTIEPPKTQQQLNDAVRSADNEGATQGDADDLASQVTKAVASKAGKTEDVLKDLVKGSEGGDEDPIGLAVTAVLGIGSLIAGGLTKDHHETFMKPPSGPIKGYATQIGAGI